MISQTPIDNKIALPEIPGSKKNENAINPINTNTINDGLFDTRLMVLSIAAKIAPARK